MMRLLVSKIFGISPSEIVVGNGVTEIINSFFSNCQKSTGVILPTFEEYPNRISKNKVIEFLPKNENFNYTVTELIEFSEKVDQLLLINPDNPSGNFLKYNEIITLLDFLKSKNKILILDESFVDFADSTDRFTFLNSELIEIYPNLIVLKSISKSYGVPGFRLGVLASSNSELINDLKSKLSIWNINSFGEYFLQIFDKYSVDYKLACDKIEKARNILYNDLLSISFIEVIPSQANYFLCRVIGPINSSQLTESLLFENDIFIKDCNGKAGFQGKSYVRIAVRDEYDNQVLIKALSKLDVTLKLDVKV
jgi:histidinol-phosphate/aromatic aminotransferase/cobyric acid decarboxylase-like protein